MRRASERIADEWLVLRAQGGDGAALAALVERNQGLILRHALRLTDSPDAAADVAQESWLAVVRRLRRLRDPRAFHAFALRIVAHKAADWTRGRVRRRAAWARLHADALAAQRGAEAAPDDPGRAVRDALAALPSDHAIVVSLHYAEGLSVAEIGAALDIPPGTVKSRLHHARERLRASIEERTQA